MCQAPFQMLGTQQWPQVKSSALMELTAFAGKKVSLHTHKALLSYTKTQMFSV